MSVRRLPVRPDLDQLKHQAKDLLRAVRAGDPAAIADFGEFHPAGVKGAPSRSRRTLQQSPPAGILEQAETPHVV